MDEAELSAQWLDVYPRAQRLLKHDAESGNKNKDAWRLALQRLSLARGGHPTAALRSALVQYLVFGANSSGVEQDFSKLHLGLGYVRGSALPSTEEFAAKAILDARQQEDKVRLVRLARITWTSCFGQARAASAQERKSMTRAWTRKLPFCASVDEPSLKLPRLTHLWQRRVAARGRT